MADTGTPDWMEASIQNLEGDTTDDATTQATVTGGEEADQGDASDDIGITSKPESKPANQQPANPKPAAGSEKPSPIAERGLLDKQGRVIANPGFELRNLDRMPTTKQYIRTIQGELETATNALTSMQTAFQSFKDVGASPEEAVVGAKLLKELQTKPAETLQFLLTQAQARGINVLPKEGGGFDPAVLRAMVDEAVRPLISDREAANKTAEVDRRAAAEAESFFSQHPDAKVHEAVLAEMVANGGYTPEHALTELKLYAVTKGLDFSKDLRAQIQAQAKNPSAGGGKPRNPQLPSSLGSGSEVIRQGTPLPADASWDAILGSVRSELARG